MGSIIDFHSHILPGMDDGSTDMMMTLSMLRSMEQQGTQIVCATSHYYAWNECIAAFLSRRRKCLAAIPTGCTGMRILPGAEVAYFERICECEDLHRLCLSGTRTLLIELPFCTWPRKVLDDLQTLSLDLGFRIVLAHPERYLFSKENRTYLQMLADSGYGFQVNADTLLSLRTRRDGLSLLKLTEAPILGTDAHNLKQRSPHLQKARAIIERKLGADFLEHIDRSAADFLAP